MVLLTYVFTTAFITPVFLIPFLIPLAKMCICKKTPTRWIFKDFKIDLLSSLTPVTIYLRFDLCYYWSVCICAIHLPQILPRYHPWTIPRHVSRLEIFALKCAMACQPFRTVIIWPTMDEKKAQKSQFSSKRPQRGSQRLWSEHDRVFNVTEPLNSL